MEGDCDTKENSTKTQRGAAQCCNVFWISDPGVCRRRRRQSFFAQTENMPVSNTEPSAGNTEISNRSPMHRPRKEIRIPRRIKVQNLQMLQRMILYRTQKNPRILRALQMNRLPAPIRNRLTPTVRQMGKSARKKTSPLKMQMKRRVV